MQEKETDELDALLKEVKPDELNSYFQSNLKYLADEKKAFYYYMKDVIDSKNLTMQDVYSFAGVSDSYGGGIIRMERHTKNRDLIIRLCIAGRFLLEEVNRALKLYGMTPLYSKDMRDACIIVALNNRKYSLEEIDDILEKQGFTKLSVDE